MPIARLISQKLVLVAATFLVSALSYAAPTATDTPTPTPIVHVQTQNVNGSSANELLGSAVAAIGDIDNDGYGDYVVGSPNYDVVSTTTLKGAGKAQVISGKTGNTLFTFYGDAAGDHFGYAVAGVASVAGLGDVDGDRINDIIIGAYGADKNNDGVIIKDAGTVKVFSGANGSLIYQKWGTGAKEYFGYAVAGLHDVDGDGFGDIAVGAYLADKTNADLSVTKDLGKVQIFVGATGTLYRTYWGDKSGDGFGFAVAYAGDIDGDNKGDMIVGAPFSDYFALKNSGSISIYSPNIDERLEFINGSQANSYFGSSVSTAGDVNRDSIPDVIVGAPKYDVPVYDVNRIQTGIMKDAGSATIFSGADGHVLYTLNGKNKGDWFGASVANIGDLEDDGYKDVAVGAPKFDVPNNYTPKTIKDAGKVYIYSGFTGLELFSINGNVAGDNFGWSISGVDIDPDINIIQSDDDEMINMVIGAPKADVVASDVLLKDAGQAVVFSNVIP